MRSRPRHAIAASLLLLTSLPGQESKSPSTAALLVHARFVLTALNHAPSACDPSAVLEDLLRQLEADPDASLDELRQTTAERLYECAPSAALAEQVLRWSEARNSELASRWLRRLTELLASERTPDLGAWITFAGRAVQPAAVEAAASSGGADPTLLAAGNQLLATHARILVTTPEWAARVTAIANRWGLDLLPLAVSLAARVAEGDLVAYTTLLDMAETSKDEPTWSLPLPGLRWNGSTPDLRGITVQPLQGGVATRCSAKGFARLGVLAPGATLCLEGSNGGTAVLQVKGASLANIPQPAPREVVVVLAACLPRIVLPVTVARVRRLADGDAQLTQLLDGLGDAETVRLHAHDEETFRDRLARFSFDLPDAELAKHLESCSLLRDAIGLREGERILPCSKAAETSDQPWRVIEVREGESRR